MIGPYRHFHRDGQRPFRDNRFVLLLIRLLAEALRPTGESVWPSADLPSLDQLVRGISDPSQPITYRSRAAERNYPEFRRQVYRMLAAPVLDDAMAEGIHSALRPFDGAFAWTGRPPLAPTKQG